MNINHENLNLEAISSDVREWYAFPEDKGLIKRFNSKEMVTPRNIKLQNESRASWDSLLILSSMTIGALAYCYKLAPAGKVIRDRMEAQMTPTRLFVRRAVPFLGLAIPFVIVRMSLQVDNGYRD